MTTSATGPKTKACESHRFACRIRSSSLGFTLIELLLVVALLALLSGSLAIGLDGWREGRALERGAEELAGTIRMARAQAALAGRPIQLAIGSDTGEPTWRIRPTATADAPSESLAWIPLDSKWATTGWHESIAIEAWHADDALPGQTAVMETDPDVGLSVRFAPDGTFDSMTVVLVSQETDDPRLAILELDGLMGTAEWRIATRGEWEAELEDRQATQVMP
jgi:type II secretion system protein H